MDAKCTPGHLVSMVLPMPDELRVYDQGEKLYPIVGLIQHCTPINIEGEPKYQVGVGFIGRNAPESYQQDPNQSYRISGMGPDGLWQVTEGKQFKPRKNPRFWLSIKVSLSLIQKDIRSISKEEALTQNISSSGVAVISELEAKAGDRVKFACKDVGFYSMAIVKDRRVSEGEPSTLHLEFLDENFPMDKLFQSKGRNDETYRTNTDYNDHSAIESFV